MTGTLSVIRVTGREEKLGKIITAELLLKDPGTLPGNKPLLAGGASWPGSPRAEGPGGQDLVGER